MEKLFAKYYDAVQVAETLTFVGYVTAVSGLLIESRGPQSVIGEICKISIDYRSKEDGAEKTDEILAEVVGLNGFTVKLMAYGETAGIEIGSKVTATGAPLEISCSSAMMGRILGPLGQPIDGKGPIRSAKKYPVMASPPPALDRQVIKERMFTGVRAVDALIPAGKGQRMGIFAGSGVGKSTFQGIIARNTNADINVIALIGERGRELNDFIEKSLGEEGLKHSVVVVVSSDQSPLCQLRGAYVATAVAEYFRNLGMNVMLLFDSVTRFARAQRLIALSSGEPAGHRGFPPSVFDLLPKLLERSGPAAKGSITAFYTVLVEGDDLDEPVADNVRAVLDGHIVLSRRLASRGHYPAVDVLDSVSRVATEVAGGNTQVAAAVVKRLMADYSEAEDIINAGAYKTGSNPNIDSAIAKHDAIEDFLIQGVNEKTTLAETLSRLSEISGIEIPDSERLLYETSKI
ncbi:MAG: flagellar protein export ATPase FliI [Termitinemataceae bacterium]|nr:MAG: flagellar protein export ATPase FliI [Termitinemataceae bacterium]